MSIEGRYMNDICEREVLLNRDGQWLALEGDYWIPLLRLLRAYGLEPDAYEPPSPGGRNYVNADATRELVACLTKALDDIPREDLWRHHRHEPDPSVAPPHEYFSGVGLTYLTNLMEFVGTGGFFLEVTEPGTDFSVLGVVRYRPGR